MATYGDDTLERIARTHVAYEVGTMVNAAIALVRPVSPAEEELMALAHNALVESFVLHARNVHDFFDLGPKKYVVAQHYLGSWKRSRLLTRDEYNRANVQMAHIDASRVEGFEWRFHDLIVKTRALFERFETELSEREPIRVAWFAPALTEARRVLARTETG